MEIQDAKQARPHCELIAELLDSRQPKTEREHAAVREIERLRHDIERHIAIASEYATECERLRAELAECRLVSNRRFLDYGWHKDGCAFREDCDQCDCGFDALLREALTINKQARKGEGE